VRVSERERERERKRERESLCVSLRVQNRASNHSACNVRASTLNRDIARVKESIKSLCVYLRSEFRAPVVCLCLCLCLCVCICMCMCVKERETER